VLKLRSEKYVGYDKTRFSVISAHIKRAGHPLPLISKEQAVETSSATWARTVTQLNIYVFIFGIIEHRYFR
jgi:hypothetical protein